MNDAHEIIPGLYLGNYQVARSLPLLKYMKITHVLNCGRELSDVFDTQFVYKHLPLADVPSENIEKYFGEAYQFIDDAMAQGGKVFVHCAAGVSRSTTIVISYLAKRYGQTPEDVLANIRKIRAIVNPNPGFMQQLNQAFRFSPLT